MKLLYWSFIALIINFTAAAQVKKPQPERPPVTSALSNQLVVVTAENWNTFTAKARIFERKNARSVWKQVGEAFPVVVGRNGLAYGGVTAIHPGTEKIKQEGDGNAPAGIFPLTSVFGSSTKPEAVELPYTKLDRYTECVDDVRSSFYNRIVNRMQVGNFDWKSSEKMLAVGPEYELGIFVAYNRYPVVPSRGSCIFLHIWKGPDAGTSGCTAMERRHLERLAAWLSPKKNPYLVQMPEDVYERQRKAWNFPKLN